MKTCIIGRNSYIGNHIDRWLSVSGHEVYQLDVLAEDWRAFDLTPFDIIVHVAGIVHRPDCSDEDLYKRVNTDLPIEIASLFKNDTYRRKTFVFLSTMAVFGTTKRLKKNIVDASTPIAPNSLYGKSKKAAEDGLIKLQNEHFNVIIIRPPNVYGKGCKGGYIPGFLNVVKKMPVIPEAYTDIKQSILYIDNLCELIRLLVEEKRHGIFMPQDEKPVSAIDIINAISTGIGKKIWTSKLLGMGARIFSFMPIIKKAYGGIEYSEELSDISGINYRIVSFEDAMKRTVN